MEMVGFAFMDWLLLLLNHRDRVRIGTCAYPHHSARLFENAQGSGVAAGTWVGARAQSVLMSVWRTCWQQGRSALDFLSHFLRGKPVTLALPPLTHHARTHAARKTLSPSPIR